jgi:hypothetical protein
MLDSWSMHDYEQNFIIDCMKTCLVYDLCLLGFSLNVHHVLGVWFIFVKKILCFCVFFLVLICFWFNCLFCFSFGLNHGFRFGSGLNECFRVNPIGFVLGQVLRFYLVGYFFCWGIFDLRGCLTNISIGLFWQFCFE